MLGLFGCAGVLCSPALGATGVQPVLCTYAAAAVPCPPGSTRVAPNAITYGADGRTELTHIRWSQWGAPVATATATNAFNGGPAGAPQWTRYGVRVRASDLATCDGHRTYLTVTVRAVRPSQGKDVGVDPTNLRSLWHRCS